MFRIRYSGLDVKRVHIGIIDKGTLTSTRLYCTLYSHSAQMTNRRPTLRIDLDSPVPHYRQIVDSIRTHLVEGHLVPGEALPSVRHLALELGITFNTVAQAYRQLAEEGWLDLKHGKRVIVIDRRAPSGASRGKVARFRRRIREMVAQMRAEGLSPVDIAAELRRLAGRLEP